MAKPFIINDAKEIMFYTNGTFNNRFKLVFMPVIQLNSLKIVLLKKGCVCGGGYRHFPVNTIIIKYLLLLSDNLYIVVFKITYTLFYFHIFVFKISKKREEVFNM